MKQTITFIDNQETGTSSSEATRARRNTEHSNDLSFTCSEPRPDLPIGSLEPPETPANSTHLQPNSSKRFFAQLGLLLREEMRLASCRPSLQPSIHHRCQFASHIRRQTCRQRTRDDMSGGGCGWQIGTDGGW